MSSRNIQSVLYVDDDPHVCKVVQATLCSIAGLNVHTVGAGERAIDLAYEWRPDLILMDVMMPGLGGPDTFKRMREHALLAHIPIIFLTEEVLPAEIAHFLQLGAIGVIGKPVDPLKLGHELFAIWEKADVPGGFETARAGRSQERGPLGSLTDSFLLRTKNDIVRLRIIIERARHEDRSVLAEAGRIAHTIHGAGAMLGFPEIGAAGGAIERVIERVMSSTAAFGAPCDPLSLQQLLNCMSRLAQGVDASERIAHSGSTVVRGLGSVR
jgi:two-component system OmpR family response regulator